MKKLIWKLHWNSVIWFLYKIYSVFLRIQFECGKIRTRITPNRRLFLQYTFNLHLHFLGDWDVKLASFCDLFFCHSRRCVNMSSLWQFIRLPYESSRVGTCVMSLVPWLKASNIVHILGWNSQGILIWDQENYIWISSKSFFKFLKNFRQQDFFAMSAIQMIIISWFLCSCIIDVNCPVVLVIRFHFIRSLICSLISFGTIARLRQKEGK